MKKILFALLLIGFSTKAQNDSTKVTVTLQARDCEYIGLFIAHNPDYEDLFDGMKIKFRVANPPVNTTNVTIDTIPIGQWLRLSEVLRTDAYAIGGNVLSRYDAALRAVNNSYMTGKLNDNDSEDTNVFMSRRSTGRFRLRRQ